MTFPTSNVLSAHRDVLDAPIPETPEEKSRLVEELKNRARAAVQAKAYPDAHLLYKRALEVEPDNAVLYSNLALVQNNMGHYEEARRSATLATELDPSYTKGHYRLGQALEKLDRPQEALESMTQALSLEPDNKALKKEVDKLQKRVKEEEDLMKMDVDTAAAASTEKTSEKKTTAAPPVKKTAKKESATTKKKDTSAMKVENDEELFTKSDHVKGYKVVNGKKTSYFHRELTEQEKQMIGDIAPKKLETAPTPVATAPTDGSAWNKAGTWEERDVTAWAKETLKEKLMQTCYTLPDSSPTPGAIARITKVPKLDGHASFATVRGKKRYIYEFLIQVEWEFEYEGETATGKMTFPDVDGTCELGEGYEMVHYEVGRDSPSAFRPILDRFVKNGGLREQLHESLDDWVRLFRETY